MNKLIVLGLLLTLTSCLSIGGFEIRPEFGKRERSYHSVYHYHNNRGYHGAHYGQGGYSGHRRHRH